MNEVVEHGLPGDHHFYITFKTRYPGVDIPAYLKQKYEDEMTIVIQHQYWGLKASDEGFEVLLSFNDVHERLAIPYAAITGFVDPSVKFGLQFQVQTGDADAELVSPEGRSDGVIPLAPAAGLGDPSPAKAGRKSSKATSKTAAKPAAETPDADATDAGEDAPAEDTHANVVTLDTFRKK